MLRPGVADVRGRATGLAVVVSPPEADRLSGMVLEVSIADRSGWREAPRLMLTRFVDADEWWRRRRTANAPPPTMTLA